MSSISIKNQRILYYGNTAGYVDNGRAIVETTLTPIVSKLSDMRIVNAELEYMVFEPRKEFIIMVILVIGNIPIMYFLNRSWYETLMHTAIEQFVLAVCAAAIFISTAFVIRLTKPIEYRR
jgi:tight adherence protein B